MCRARNSGDEEIIENGQLASFVSHAEEVLRHDEIMADFQAKIAVKGWKIRGQTPSDGNCFFFWANSDQLDKVQGNSKSHSQLRKCVVEHIKNLSEVQMIQLNFYYFCQECNSGEYCLLHLCLVISTGYQWFKGN